MALEATRAPGEVDVNAAAVTLHPHGFSARRFVEVIEEEVAWEGF